MSTVKVINVQHPSSGSANLTTDANGNVSSAGTIAMATPFGTRNKIINGAMIIDQRNAGASVTPNNSYTLDRWIGINSQTGKFTVQQNAGSVTPPAGFINYLGATSTSAYSVGAGDYFCVTQFIEGLNITDLGWGSANAKTVTLSFWVRSSLTGTFGGALQNSGSTRSYPFTYTVSSANTWEKKSVTVPGDTTGTWLTNNNTGIQLNFGLGTGSTYSGAAGSWAGANYISATGAVSVVGTNGATFYITGVQFEVGSIATPFEQRLMTQEMVLCQRYYEVVIAGGNSSLFRWYGASSSEVCSVFPMKVQKRTSPTMSGGTITEGNCSGTTFSDVSSLSYRMTTTVTSAGMCFFYFSTYVSAVAEL